MYLFFYYLLHILHIYLYFIIFICICIYLYTCRYQILINLMILLKSWNFYLRRLLRSPNQVSIPKFFSKRWRTFTYRCGYSGKKKRPPTTTTNTISSSNSAEVSTFFFSSLNSIQSSQWIVKPWASCPLHIDQASNTEFIIATNSLLISGWDLFRHQKKKPPKRKETGDTCKKNDECLRSTFLLISK